MRRARPSAREGGQHRRSRCEGIDQRVDALYSLFESVEAAGLGQRSVVRVLDVHTAGTVAAHLGLEESSPLVHLERLRLAGDDPLAFDRAWLPASIAAPLLDADFRTPRCTTSWRTCARSR